MQIDLHFVWVVEIDLISLWGIELDLIPVQFWSLCGSSKMTLFQCGGSALIWFLYCCHTAGDLDFVALNNENIFLIR